MFNLANRELPYEHGYCVHSGTTPATLENIIKRRESTAAAFEMQFIHFYSGSSLISNVNPTKLCLNKIDSHSSTIQKFRSELIA